MATAEVQPAATPFRAATNEMKAKQVQAMLEMEPLEVPLLNAEPMAEVPKVDGEDIKDVNGGAFLDPPTNEEKEEEKEEKVSAEHEANSQTHESGSNHEEQADESKDHGGKENAAADGGDGADAAKKVQEGMGTDEQGNQHDHSSQKPTEADNEEIKEVTIDVLVAPKEERDETVSEDQLNGALVDKLDIEKGLAIKQDEEEVGKDEGLDPKEDDPAESVEGNGKAKEDDAGASF